ncbi:DUF2059 domain-containing protein [Brevundimonas sp.]|uniref:DUF2059 domain-containing protein n=1 Tax=Brevundimonas sp. TaxID=1871086 RepID=UPI0028A99CA2|nr:DUF2059 domain-containing protein [Brevundimonas sp.]
MHRISLIVILAALLLAGSAHAQDDARPALANRLVVLSANGMDKVLQQAIDQAFGDFDDSMPDEQVRWLRRNAAPIVQAHMRPLLAATAAAYAELFTEAELTAMIAFYETPLGQNVARKQLEVSVELEPAMLKFQEDFMTEIMTKFCGQFDCEDEVAKEPLATKPNRH